VDPGQVADIAANRNQSAAHGVTDFIPSITTDQNRSFCHTTGASSIGGADQVPRFAADMDQTTMHFTADPIASVALDMDFATAHFAANMSATTALDYDLAGLHFRADPVDAAQIALPFVDFIVGRTTDSKKIGEARFDVAFEDFQLFNFRDGLAAD